MITLGEIGAVITSVIKSKFVILSFYHFGPAPFINLFTIHMLKISWLVLIPII